MRILLTADPMLPVPPPLYGGIERIIDLLVRGYMARGHKVALVSHRDSTSAATVRYSWPRESVSALSSLRGAGGVLRAATREFAPDVIHSFSRLLWLLAIADYPQPRVMSYQREPSGRTVRLSNLLHRGKLSFTGCSEYIARNGRERGRGNWTAIWNAIDLATYTFAPRVAADAPLVFLSRIEEIKGCHDAIAIAKRSGRRLLIAGNCLETGEAAVYWRERILPEVGRNGIEYVGPVNDEQKNQLLGQAAAMVVPICWNEPFGIVFIEALACGTPVISCARGALPEIVTSGEHGFLISGVEEGVRAVESISTIDRGACRRRVESCFSSEAVTAAYLDLFARLRREQA